VANFLTHTYLRLPFQAGRVWWVANLLKKMKSEKEEFKHTRNVLMDPLDLAKTENPFLFHITTNKNHSSIMRITEKEILA